MDPAPQENPPKDFNKIDLSQLQGFSFGTQWTQDKTAPGQGRGRDDRSRRDGPFDRLRPGGGEHGDDRPAERRDRRAFRKPAGDSAPAGAPPAGGDRRPRRDFDSQRGAPMERGPYESPYFAVTFYPEDNSFAALAKTIRASSRTFELFEIARTVIGKPDRFVVVLQRRTAEAEKPAPVYLSAPDGLPFESEDAAIAHVMEKHVGTFFDSAEVEIEPPKGNFQVINRCGVTGDLLGPPNYHRYTQIIQRHHAAKVTRLPFDAFKSRIETLRDPEVINQWLEKMKRTTRFTLKAEAPKPEGQKPAEPAVAAVADGGDPGSATPATTEPPAAPTPAPTEAEAAAPAPAPAAVVAFDSVEDARAHLLSNARERVVRAVEHARFHGKLTETLVAGEIRYAVEGALERQRRFPLDTANALRGRLRREGFTIFKKGSKGISYVCAVKRKFRVPGQVFSDSIGSLIGYIEANPMCRAGDLPEKVLGVLLPSVDPAADKTPVTVSPEDRTRVIKLQGDLSWLVREGYVTEFIDGRLFAPPAMVEARKKEIEASENDPENFPEQAAEPLPKPESVPGVGVDPELDVQRVPSD